jgi:hypothetical protein
MQNAPGPLLRQLSTGSLLLTSQFASPVTSPTRHPNFVLNQRADMDFTLQPPAYVEILDVRIFSLEG